MNFSVQCDRRKETLFSVVNPKTQKEYIVKKLIFQYTDQEKFALKRIDQCSKMPNPFLLKIQHIARESIDEMDNVFVFMDRMECNLEDYIQRIRQQRGRLSLDEIKNFVKPIYLTLKILDENSTQKNRIAHENLKPENVLMNKKGIFKLGDASLETPKTANQLRKLWYAPELTNTKSFWLENNWKTKQNMNLNKCDSFSFGLVILHAALMKPIEELQVFKDEGEEAQEKQKQMLQEIQNLYGLEITVFVQDLIKRDIKFRKSPKQIREQYINFMNCQDTSNFFSIQGGKFLKGNRCAAAHFRSSAHFGSSVHFRSSAHFHAEPAFLLRLPPIAGPHRQALRASVRFSDQHFLFFL